MDARPAEIQPAHWTKRFWSTFAELNALPCDPSDVTRRSVRTGLGQQQAPVPPRRIKSRSSTFRVS
jgi:hypothetical protein